MRTRAGLALATVLLLLPIAVLGRIDAKPPPTFSAAGEVRTILTAAAAVTPCDRHCHDCLFSSKHRSVQDSGGAFGGSYHDCEFTTTGCGYHGCGIAFLPAQLEMVVDLVAGLSRDELLSISTEGLGLLINLEREAVQVVDCDGSIIATVRFSATQAAQFRAAAAT